MLGFRRSTSVSAQRKMAALDRSLAIIEFDLEGVILSANENFCQLLGYTQAEIVGKHHRLFVPADYAVSAEYREFWEQLRRGEFDSRSYRRICKDGRSIWIQASYNPVRDAAGKPVSVIKVASDITAQKRLAMETEARMAALSQVQAIVEFTPDGQILGANEIFLRTMGYSREEIIGKRHALFVGPDDAKSEAYREFWRKLAAGETFIDCFRRYGKGGQEKWFQASYGPVYDVDGRIAKIIKFASDISDLMHLGAGLARLAGNDVSRGIETPFSPTFERLRLDFNTAMANLGSTLGEVVGSAAAVDSGASEIAVASGDLSRRTEQQAASLEETAAALEQVTKTVKQTSQSAKRAHHVVSEARGDAQTSGQIVGRTVEAMGRIETSSGQINQIISVIDEIAFQTNLLALNAGVEAARAGEAGRGFAVVASEVRALAQRSADAAKQIKGLISSSAGEVEAGVKLVRDAGDSLARIVAKVMEINEEVAGIATGAEEQARALDSVNMAVAEMDQATQQNAAMAEQANAATTAMLNECRKLSQSADRFTLSGEPAKAPPFLASRPVGLAPTRRPEPAARRA